MSCFGGGIAGRFFDRLDVNASRASMSVGMDLEEYVGDGLGMQRV